MKNRPRPYIPLHIKVAVIERQMVEIGHWTSKNLKNPPDLPLAERLRLSQIEVFGVAVPHTEDEPPLHVPKLHLDHDPPLRTRKFNQRTEKFTPDANDPRYLVWRTAEDHHRKTNIRGNGAQFSDTVLIKRERKREKRSLGMVKRKIKIPSRPFPEGRPFPSRP